MGLIFLALNVLHALAESIPTLVQGFVDIRQAMRETARAGKKHFRKAMSASKRKYEKRRQKHERAKRRHR